MKYLLFIFLFTVGLSTSAQDVRVQGKIVNAKTNEPISLAFLFVNNTSFGTETDVQGQFILTLPEGLSGDLIVSHINYSSKSISFSHPDEIPELIPLDLEPYKLDEVLVTENKGKSRKKWLKKFTEAFLGERDPDKIEIINPEDILFRENKDTLEAIALQPITINNYRLGYQVKFFLEQFVQQKDQVVYSGKAFFEELDGINNNIEESREKEYYQSLRYFFRNLIDKSVPDDFFDCYESRFLESGDYMITDSYDVREHVFQLYNSGYYVLAIPDALYINGFGELKSRQYNRIRKKLGKYSSFLVPQSRVIIFNKNGVVINFNEVEEIGYWATKRLASMLPLDYTPLSEQRTSKRDLDWISLGFIANSIFAEDSISTRMKEDGMLVDPVDLFLHTDRSVYLPGETMWFSVYGRRNKTKLLGNYGVAVELINEFNEVEEFKIIPTDDGIGTGFIDFSDSLIAGVYLLRYYLINNELESIYSEMQISIVSKNPSTGVSVEGLTSQLADSVIIRFFPEGGELIEGLKTKVAYEVTDDNGNYIDFE